MTELVRLNGIAAKIEGTYGTDATPSPATEGIQIEEHFYPQLTWGYLEDNLRDNMAQAGMGRAGLSSPEARWAQLELEVALKGREAAFAAGVLPEMDVLLRACGMEQTLDVSLGTEKVTYTLRSTGFESATIYGYSAGMLYKILGARGSVRFVLTPGQFGRAIFSIQGLLETDPTEIGLPSAFAYPAKTVEPPTVKAAGLTLNAFDPSDFSDFELDTQVEIAELPRGNATNAHAGYEPVDWNPQFTTTIDRPALASLNPWTLQEAGTLFAWDIGPIGGTQYNQVKLSGPKGRIIDAGGSESDGLAMTDLTVRCQNTDEETPDDAVSLEFT